MTSLPHIADPHHDRLSAPIRLDRSGVAGDPASHPHLNFVYEVARRAGVPTWLEALECTRAILRALGEWLAWDQRAAVARHLPSDLAQALTDRATGVPRRDDVVALYRAAAAHHRQLASLHDVALQCAAVLAVLGETLPDDLAAELVDELPADIAALMPVRNRDRALR